MGDIDIVLPWVNGLDEKWQEQLFYLFPEKKNNFDEERYRDWDLLRYWFRGIESFAPWIRKIHFITWGHLPEWLDISHPKLNVVYHKDYIPEQYLPVFSSHPIEIFINRIQGLAEQFIYFNDDMFILDVIDEKDFFISGKPCDIAGFNAISPVGICHILLNNTLIVNRHFKKHDVIKNNLSKWISFRNFDKTLRTIALLPWPNITGFFDHHLPQAYLKSTLDEVWDIESEELLTTAVSKLRNNNDINMYLFRYWHLCQGNFENISLKGFGQYFNVSNESIDMIAEHISRKRSKVITLNDSENIDFQLCQTKMAAAFHQHLPNICQFELYE